MEHREPEAKSVRDRIRQQRGAQRKSQMKVIRKIVAAWKDGRDAGACMQDIDDTLAGRERP